MRNVIYDIVKHEYVGPNPIEGFTQDNGEEKLIESPIKRYFAGILFPIASRKDRKEDFEDEKEGIFDDIEDPVVRTNTCQQSALGMTVFIKKNDFISVDISGACYQNNQKEYLRIPINWNNSEEAIGIPEKGKINEYKIPNQNNLELIFRICNRYEKEDFQACTFTLENRTLCKQRRLYDVNSIFQTEISLQSKLGFIPLKSLYRVGCEFDEDYMSNQLFYKDKLNYAMGHGCAAEWDYTAKKVTKINTTVMPSYEVKPISPSKIEGLSLEMYKFSDRGDQNYIYSEINKLCEEYSKWINRISEDVKQLSDNREIKTAKRHIKACKECLRRMRDGLLLLKNDTNVRQAFQLMNRAMLLQQLHYNLPNRKWNLTVLEDDIWELDDDIILPDIDKKDTWFRSDQFVYGRWRPFQLAFILINLRSMLDKHCDDRKKVDLIWFPTGGGKTEAYLGLSAYTIFIRRILNRDDYGTTIIMRYTLRLLTSQQYARAASMICACDVIRRENPNILGKEQISIGLWVGGENSYNRVDDAIRDRNALECDSTINHLFLILKCPWCGAEMGVINLKDSHKVAGYEKVNRKGFQYRCHNKNCDFFCGLPLITIDEQIYENPPTLLIGTVDKFANLPILPKARAIFGFIENKEVNPPDLIIQDELHLISGPLGSMVGIYETLISAMCKKKGVSPKIIASTATISRAKEQCNALYACRNKVYQFPPSGISYQDSFFAYENNTVQGRRYVGVVAQNKKSSVMGGSNLIATLLYAGDRLKRCAKYGIKVDPYWTNIAYFNSIRELGKMVTFYDAEIIEQLKVLYKRNRDNSKCRFLHPICELTSRESSSEIPTKMKNLSRILTDKNQDDVVDLCVSTNMISVGVDIPRLGLMTVFGQPKTTSEYIQATSRVGRKTSKPGIVFIYYNLLRSRDRSHYEHFVDYHSRLYCGVEPTSVTPFSKPARERALAAVVIGIVRLKYLYQQGSRPYDLTQDMIDDVTEIVINRVHIVAPEEEESTRKDLELIFSDWQNFHANCWKATRYSKKDTLPLMITNKLDRESKWRDRSFLIPTSMRTVDVECNIEIAKRGLK